MLNIPAYILLSANKHFELCLNSRQTVCILRYTPVFTIYYSGIWPGLSKFVYVMVC